jgi:hypothetical protein
MGVEGPAEVAGEAEALEVVVMVAGAEVVAEAEGAVREAGVRDEGPMAA